MKFIKRYDGIDRAAIRVEIVQSREEIAELKAMAKHYGDGDWRQILVEAMHEGLAIQHERYQDDIRETA